MENRFEFRESLGRGGVSEVIRAFDRRDSREVAIKRLLPWSETRLNEPRSHDLKREIEALSRLKHPNVIELYEVAEDSEGAFAVLELIKGDSLHNVIHEGALTYPDFFDLATQLLSALSAAEEIQLLHRDLKPGNIMVQINAVGQFEAKILDFGVSKFASQPRLQTVDHKGAILGSIDYISPEQLEMHPLDSRSDLYSLGCILYFCFTQKAPFHRDSPAETVRAHLEHEVTPLHRVRPDLPRIVCDWVMNLMERYPENRPCGAQAALDLLEELTDLEQVPGARLSDLGKSGLRVGHHLAPRGKRKDTSAEEAAP